MANSVDDKVVRLQFENAQFESRMASTLAQLQKLEQALALKTASSGLKDVDAASKRLSFEQAAQGVQGLSAKFLALSTVAITALSNITNRAINAGVSIVKSLSIQGVMDGFREYEQGIGSIQTILSNTRNQGTNLQQVNSALDELNTYADKTIYNFGQMTRNIGTFTAAGVKLDVALPSIKGIANLAAMSGSSAEQASTAMYQLSQAIAAGSVKLMDWNSVVNAGMGGRVFQEALFESGKAMKTLKGVDMATTFDQWTASGHSFRESLQDGWITGDVLTTTLGAMSGEMDVAKLKAKGFSDTQIKAMQELGKAGVEAATKVRTFTGLIGTLKESIGSGWSESFRNIIGNFDEATNLFTGLSNTIGGFISRGAAVRNMTLLGAKQGGAMVLVINGLRTAFAALGNIFRSVSAAFREVFPRKTATDLINMARSFNDFTQKLLPTPRLLIVIRNAAEGFFSVLKIGWTIIKEGVKFIGNLVRVFAGFAGGGILNAANSVGVFISHLREVLVDGGGIQRFFDNLNRGVQALVPYLNAARDAIGRFLGQFKSDSVDKMSGAVDKANSRFGALKGALGKVGDFLKPLFDSMDNVGDRLDKVFTVIKDWFKQLGQKIADNMGQGDWSNVLDAINTGLLGGIALLLGKWLKKGINLDFGGGMLDSIKSSFEQLTSTLSTMQTKVKAEALEKIAIAVGILTASVVALSLIDSGSLTKALTAMGVGFGQLLGAFAIINSMNSDAKSAAKFAAVATGLNLLATAMVTLSLAVVILAQLSWADLAKGLSAVTALLIVLTAISGPLAKGSLGMISAGVGITALAVGLNILAGAVKLFSMMSWSEIGKGLVAISVGLLLIGVSMQAMPATLPITAAGLIEVAIALNILAGAVKIFATMSWEDLGKGAAALAGGLLIIAGAMQLMPLTLPITAAGLLLVANSLVIMAGAMKLFGTMDWGEVGRSLAVLAGSMLILSLAVNAMSGALGGAIAIGVVAGSLIVLQRALQLFADMKWGDIFKGLGAVAISLLALGATSAAMTIFIPSMIALGIALGLISAVFLVFAAGAYIAAKAFQIFAESGQKGAKAFLDVMRAMGQALPEIFVGLAKGIINFVLEIGKGIEPLVKIVGAVLDQLLDTVIKLIPKVVVVIGQLIDAMVTMGFSKAPLLLALGFFLILKFLEGLKANIAAITQAALDIVNTMLLILALNMPRIVDSGVQVILNFLQGIRDNMGAIITAGVDIIVAILNGIGANMPRIVTAAVDLIVAFINSVSDNLGRIIDAGKNLIIKFLYGVGQAALEIASAAMDVIVRFVDGLATAVERNSERLRSAGLRLGWALVDGMTGGLADKARGFIDKAGSIASDGLKAMADKFLPGSPSRVTTKFGQQIGQGLIVGMDKTRDGVVASAEKIVDNALVSFGRMNQLANMLGDVEDFQPTITPVLDLSKVEAAAPEISRFISAQKVQPTLSYKQARVLAASTASRTDLAPADTTPRSVVFNQTNNAPRQLSTADIYRQTRNQIEIAKGKLDIP